jgi:hypothetical protein
MRAYLLRQAWLVVCLTLSLAAGLYAAAAGSGPIAVIEESTFDFKEVKEGTTVQHVFRVLNKGDQALEIKNVKPS